MINTRSIDVDDEVFAFLQRQAEPFVDTANDVLRRLLLGGTPKQPARTNRRGGDLLPYVQAGMLQVGDELTHEQKRKGQLHRAVVTEDGCIEAAGQIFHKVSPALKACVGSEINGWSNWYVTRTGEVLHTVRARYRRRQEGVTES